MAHRSKPLEDDGSASTATSIEQRRVERQLAKFFQSYASNPSSPYLIRILRQEHTSFLLSGLESLSSNFEGLDASKPWLVYWIVHSLDLLGHEFTEDQQHRIVSTLSLCKHPEGGYGGGPGQLAHLAPTYAAVNALAIVGTKEAFDSIDRPQVYKFLMAMKNPADNSFSMHHGGESDTRASYTAMSVASLLNLLNHTELTSGVAENLIRCQTYEGGIGAQMYNEAHGGYTFCALAALVILNRAQDLNLRALLRWATSRQMSFEGGFQGRTNKLVDSCYSFWMGGIFPLLHAVLASLDASVSHLDEWKQFLAVSPAPSPSSFDFICKHLSWNSSSILSQISPSSSSSSSDAVLSFQSAKRRQELISSASSSSSGPSEPAAPLQQQGEDEDAVFEDYDGDWLFAQHALQEYVLLCCQKDEGGLRDKPGKGADYYHTCYALNGIAVSQLNWSSSSSSEAPALSVLGQPVNELRPLNPIYGLCKDRADAIRSYFSSKE